MTTFAIRRVAGTLGALGAAFCLLLSAAPGALAQEVTAQALIDRAAIQDLLTRYSYYLGNGAPETFASFYAEDATLYLGASVYEGRDEIRGAYASIPPDSPTRTAYDFNVVISNPLIVVHGDTATAKLIFTEVIVDEQGAEPRIRVQGREYDTLVKRDGEWKIHSRRIMSGRGDPGGWTE